MSTCGSRFEIAIVPFPFVDAPGSKRRPALILSNKTFNSRGHTVMAMITSARHAKWPTDVPIDHQGASLPAPCVVRMKIFTIDNRLIERVKGALSLPDQTRVSRQLKTILPAGGVEPATRSDPRGL
jgi:mRNA interferase MazF